MYKYKKSSKFLNTRVVVNQTIVKWPAFQPELLNYVGKEGLIDWIYNGTCGGKKLFNIRFDDGKCLYINEDNFSPRRGVV